MIFTSCINTLFYILSRYAKYNDPDKSLVVSDGALALWREEQRKKNGDDQDNKNTIEQSDPPPQPEGEEEDGKFTAVVASFSLRSSGYATMALREVLRVGTTRREQTRMTEEHLREAGKAPIKRANEDKGEEDGPREKKTKVEGDENGEEKKKNGGEEDIEGNNEDKKDEVNEAEQKE